MNTAPFRVRVVFCSIAALLGSLIPAYAAGHWSDPTYTYTGTISADLTNRDGSEVQGYPITVDFPGTPDFQNAHYGGDGFYMTNLTGGNGGSGSIHVKVTITATFQWIPDTTHPDKPPKRVTIEITPEADRVGPNGFTKDGFGDKGHGDL